MKTKRTTLFLLALTLTVFLAACSKEDKENQHADMNHNDSHEGMHDMNHSSSGELPKGLKEAVNPKFEVGSKAMIHSDHMEGMEGAEATIVGAFDTTVYTVSYTPVTGGEKVTNHKWVIHEEIKDASDQPYEPGDEVVLEADHMNGMEGAKAIIGSAQQTTVYMVDYSSTTDGEKVTNHKWVTESELSAD
ncbi:YdhK family protein [Domibacillus sp. 8LH]|uniref:YdhK family protein n=1 Tax=Domibacillus sp. 8LH TaxID=3073900 RepID=UPI00317B628C